MRQLIIYDDLGCLLLVFVFLVLDRNFRVMLNEVRLMREDFHFLTQLIRDWLLVR